MTDLSIQISIHPRCLGFRTSIPAPPAADESLWRCWWQPWPVLHASGCAGRCAIHPDVSVFDRSQRCLVSHSVPFPLHNFPRGVLFEVIYVFVAQRSRGWCALTTEPAMGEGIHVHLRLSQPMLADLNSGRCHAGNSCVAMPATASVTSMHGHVSQPLAAPAW
jgi:hypothetical protein